MGVLKLEGFTGMWPVRDPRALPPNAATYAKDMVADGGAYLDPAVAATFVFQAHPLAVYFYRLTNGATWATSTWGQFSHTQTTVVPAPIVNDSFERIYWASPAWGLRFAPKATLVALSGQLIDGLGFASGVSRPVTAPTLNVIAGTGSLDGSGNNLMPDTTRSYATSFINVYGEESQLGLTNEATGAPDQDWLLTNIPQPGPLEGRSEIQTIRVYRSVTGLTGVTAYYKVVDLAVGTTFYTDRLSDATVTGNVTAENINWTSPLGMVGIASMPNGIFAGWQGRNLYFSENYRPHAWPAEYTIAVGAEIVGCGVFGNTLVACTTGAPVAVSGVKSNALSMTKIDADLACLSPLSIVSTPEGVYYASTEGLVLFGPQGVRVVTSELISRDQWKAYNPASMRAMYVDGEYIAWTSTGGIRFSPMDPSKKGVVYWAAGHTNPYMGVDHYTGRPWVSDSYSNARALFEWEAPGGSPVAYAWKSAEFKYPNPTNFGAYEAYFDDAVGGTLRLKVWSTLRGNDGTTTRSLVYDQDIARSGQPIKLPSGFKGDVWQVEFTGTKQLQQFLMATTVKELRGA